MSLISSGSSGADIFCSVQEREAVNAIWFLLVIAPQETTYFPRTPHHALSHSAFLVHRAARSIDPHRSIRCTPLRAITQSPGPSRRHLSMSCCSGEQTVESPSRRRPLARNTQIIYRAKYFKCGWDFLFLKKTVPYTSMYPLLYTLIASQHRNHAPNGNWTLNLSRHTRTRTTVRLSHNHR